MNRFGLFQTKCRRLLRIMKLATLCMFLGIITCFATKTYSQETFFTLDVQNEQVKTVFEEIEKNSEFIIFYLDKSVNLKRKVSVSVENEPVEEILDQIFDGTNNNYSIDGRQITIYTNNTRPAPGPQRVQEKEVKGIVIDDFDEPVIGANVMVKGTANGTITDFNGEFVLTGVPEDAVIVISYIGYLTQEMSVANQTVFNIKLTEDTQQLDAVVVIGYGTVRKGDITSSVGSVKEENFLKGAVKDAGQLIQGQVAGLTITNSSGDPTSQTAVSLRGNTTILGASTNPLVLIDGVPGGFNTVAPEDIESVDVLKDGSAAAIYGSRGTNGVILITTKKAKGNNINTVEYHGYISTATVAKKLEMLTAADYRAQIAAGERSAGNDWGSSTDWLDAITHTPVSHVHNLSLRGGNENTNYSANLNYRQTQGIFLKSDKEAFQGRIEVNHNMFDNKVRLNFAVIGNQSSWTSTADGGSWNTDIYRQALNHNPTQPVTDSDGNWTQAPNEFEYINPVSMIYETDGKQDLTQTRFTGSITYNPISDLTLKGLFSYDKEHQYGGYYESQNHFTAVSGTRNGYAAIGSATNMTKLMELTGQYNKTIKDHTFSVLAGYSWQGTDYSNQYERNYDFPADTYSYFNIGMGSALKEGKGTMYSYAVQTNLISFFGRVSYNYKNRYLLLLSLRHEAASQLYGSDNEWGTFPSVSAAWRISEEEFMKEQNIFQDLKLRAGYGVTGSQPADSYLALSLLNYSGYFYYNGEWKETLRPSQNPNPDLKWEEKHETNIGLDFSVLNGRLGGSLDYYYREIRDLLYDYSVPSPPNVYTTTRANVGTMSNTGFEALINFEPVVNKNFAWNSTVTFSTNRNKLKSLSNDMYEASADYFTTNAIGPPMQTDSHIVQVGESIGNFFGFKVIDIDDDGFWVYEDKEGNAVSYQDFGRDFEDKQVIGNGLPKYHLSWNNHFRYKDFDLAITMRGAFGFQIINTPRMFYENRTREDWNRLKSSEDLVFGKTRLTSSTEWSQEFNSYYVENGDFWKIDNVTLGYTFRDLKTKYIKSLRIYASCLNLATITGYKGVDPEVSISGLNPGYDDRYSYPTTRSYTFGVNLTF